MPTATPPASQIRGQPTKKKAINHTPADKRTVINQAILTVKPQATQTVTATEKIAGIAPGIPPESLTVTPPAIPLAMKKERKTATVQAMIEALPKLVSAPPGPAAPVPAQAAIPARVPPVIPRLPIPTLGIKTVRNFTSPPAPICPIRTTRSPSPPATQPSPPDTPPAAIATPDS